MDFSGTGEVVMHEPFEGVALERSKNASIL
jgi:hypothetical protein